MTARQIKYDIHTIENGPGRPKGLGQISFLFDLNRKGHPSGQLEQAIAHVSWAPTAGNWDIDEFGWPPEETVLHGSGILFKWIGSDEDDMAEQTASDWPDASWTYVVPLDAIKDEFSAERLLILPPLQLVQGASVEDAFANASEVLRFAETEKGLQVLDGALSA